MMLMMLVHSASTFLQFWNPQGSENPRVMIGTKTDLPAKYDLN